MAAELSTGCHACVPIPVMTLVFESKLHSHTAIQPAMSDTK